MSNPASVSELVSQLVAHVTQGRILEAYDALYAENVVMQENNNPPTVGKAANRVREEQFVGSVKEVHENLAANVLVDGNKAVIEWVLEFTNQDGARLKFDQIALQTWENGQITEERFFYDSGSLVQAA
jgi:ketosteroid isomerase-like protein